MDPTRTILDLTGGDGPRMARVTPGLDRQPEKPVESDSWREELALALAVMRNNRGNPHFDLAACARERFVSERSLQRLFARFGTTFREQLTRMRMEKAKQLLLESRLSIAEIAARVGYSQPMHFAKAYRRYHGASPREERRAAGLPARTANHRVERVGK